MAYISNITDDPRFIALLEIIRDLADGPVGPYIDGRRLASALGEGLENTTGISLDEVSDLRAFTTYGRNMKAWVESLNKDFRFDIYSIDVDDGTTVIKPSDIDVADPGRWIEYVSSGGGTGEVYSNASPTPQPLGGIPTGTTFVSQTMQQMWDALLYPYQAPAFNSFSISGQPNPLEVGASIPAGVTFLWGTTNPTNINPNSLTLRDVTNGFDLATGLPDTGSHALVMGGPITKLARASHIFRVSGINTQMGIFLRDATYSWIWRRYWGSSALVGPLTPAQILALVNTPLTDGFAADYSFPAVGSPEYKYICYASVLGTATSFIDPGTMLTIPMQPVYTVPITNGLGQTTNYNVHRTTNQSAGAVVIRVS